MIVSQKIFNFCCVELGSIRIAFIVNFYKVATSIVICVFFIMWSLLLLFTMLNYRRWCHYMMASIVDFMHFITITAGHAFVFQHVIMYSFWGWFLEVFPDFFVLNWLICVLCFWWNFVKILCLTLCLYSSQCSCCFCCL